MAPFNGVPEFRFENSFSKCHPNVSALYNNFHLFADIRVLTAVQRLIALLCDTVVVARAP